MPELTGDQSNVSKIVADALKVTADALASWLNHPIDSQDVVATKLSLAVPHEVMCCCTMPVDVTIGAPRLSDPSAKVIRSAGLLLLAWRSEEAAWLIDQCELKGKKHKGAAVHYKQPLVLINQENATGNAILELSRLIQKDVKEKFGILLEPEVRIV